MEHKEIDVIEIPAPEIATIEYKSNESHREYKAFSFSLNEADSDTGEFSGYAAVFGNVDSGQDIIEKGAFAKTLQDISRVKILTNHNENELPIGKPLELREDEKGLYIRAKISDTTTGRDIRTLLKDGVLNELSIGYDVVKYNVDNKGIRHLKELRLWEVSVVTWAMNDQAVINEVKSTTLPCINQKVKTAPLPFHKEYKSKITFKLI